MKFLFTKLILLSKERNNFQFKQVFTVKENIGPIKQVWGHIMACYQLLNYSVPSTSSTYRPIPPTF